MKKKSVNKAEKNEKDVKEVSEEERNQAVCAALESVGIRSFTIVFNGGDDCAYGMSRGMNRMEIIGMMCSHVIKVAMK